MSLFQGSYYLPWPILLSVLLATLNGVVLWRYLQKNVSPASGSFGKRHPWIFFCLHAVFALLSLLLPVIYHLKSVEDPRVYAPICGTYWNLLSSNLLVLRLLDYNNSRTRCIIVVSVIAISSIAAGVMLFFRFQFAMLDLWSLLLCHTVAAIPPCIIVYNLWLHAHKRLNTWVVVIVIIAAVILTDGIVLGILKGGEHRILAAWFLAFIPSILTEFIWLYKEFIEVDSRGPAETSGHQLESPNQGDASSIQTEETLIPAGSCHDPTKNRATSLQSTDAVVPLDSTAN